MHDGHGSIQYISPFEIFRNISSDSSSFRFCRTLNETGWLNCFVSLSYRPGCSESATSYLKHYVDHNRIAIIGQNKVLIATRTNN